MRGALVVGGYLAASALAAVVLGEGADGGWWILSTVLVHVGLALAVGRWWVLSLPFAFIALLAAADALFVGADTGEDCHDWCGSMTLTAGFVIFWLPYALLAAGATLCAVRIGRAARRQGRSE